MPIAVSYSMFLVYQMFSTFMIAPVLRMYVLIIIWGNMLRHIPSWNLSLSSCSLIINQVQCLFYCWCQLWEWNARSQTHSHKCLRRRMLILQEYRRNSLQESTLSCDTLESCIFPLVTNHSIIKRESTFGVTWHLWPLDHPLMVFDHPVPGSLYFPRYFLLITVEYLHIWAMKESTAEIDSIELRKVILETRHSDIFRMVCEEYPGRYVRVTE